LVLVFRIVDDLADLSSDRLHHRTESWSSSRHRVELRSLCLRW
jgi:4-hydroxybenzoate polyprenyltransferase